MRKKSLHKQAMPYQLKQPVNEAEFKRYYHLRWQLLRAPWQQPEGSESDDIEDRYFHIMAIDDAGEIIGVARLQFNCIDEAQIRYMAISPPYERQGIGRALIHALEQRAKKSSHKKIILDAREPAVDFYKNQGYQIIEKSYLLFDEIQHFRMSKTL